VIYIAATVMVSRSDQPLDDTCAITIIIPVYNTEAYLKECIDSVLNQSFQDFELICVDDESTDGSLPILRGYENRDTRVKAVAMSHGGQSAARNLGMREAHGKYIYFMDSDDKLADGALQTMYALIEERDVDILYFDGATFFDTAQLAEEYAKYDAYHSRPVSYREVVTGAALFTRMSMDNEYWVSPCLQILKHDYIKAINFQFYEGIIYEDNLSTYESMLQAERVSHENVRLYLRRIRRESTVTGERTYRNFYGFFICWLMMASFARSHNYPRQTRKEIRKRIDLVRLKAIKRAESVPLEEIEKNVKMESSAVRFMYYAAFHPRLARNSKRKASMRENWLRLTTFKALDGAGYRLGVALAGRRGWMSHTRPLTTKA
jgi:glycosyltransferase involved in cell wall biosynthesis